MTKPSDLLTNVGSAGGFLAMAIALARRMFNVQKLTFRVVDQVSEDELKKLREEVADLRFKVKTGEYEREALQHELAENQIEIAALRKRIERP